MTDRVEIPARRPQALFDFKLDGASFTFTGSLGWVDRAAMRRGDDPVEVFLSCDRSTEIEALGRDVAVLVSLLRQHGCSFATMRAAVTRLADPTRPGDARPAPASLVGRLLDEVECFTSEEAMALAEQPGAT